MQKVIGICGLIGSGKGTVADILVEQYNFNKISFADKLKDAVSELFGWDRKMLEGETSESRVWREQEDSFWTKETGRKITPRLVLHEFGTDCMRNGFYDGIWVSMVKQKILNFPTKNFVIPDVRFPNEMKMIQEFIGGEVWQVRRGELPLWWATAKNVNQNWERAKDTHHSMKAVFPEVHSSEWRWVDEDKEFNTIITNDKTIQDLNTTISNLVSS